MARQGGLKGHSHEDIGEGRGQTVAPNDDDDGLLSPITMEAASRLAEMNAQEINGGRGACSGPCDARNHRGESGASSGSGEKLRQLCTSNLRVLEWRLRANTVLVCLDSRLLSARLANSNQPTELANSKPSPLTFEFSTLLVHSTGGLGQRESHLH